ncbi:MAG: TetR family transcriptional regulator [Mycobacterium sp.]|nr:TetR family transcriptional regulator [Mycobacterium sp.]
MSTRRESAARTRMSLIDAGLRLAERTGLSGLSINLLVEEAQVSKGTFFHHFGDRSSYVLALHREFHERLLTEIDNAISGLEPGRRRLITAATTYLDGCLRDRGVRALLLEARADPLIAHEISARNASSANLIETDFAAMGWPHPNESAQLWVGMTAEAALIELKSGRRSEAVRAALGRFTES